MEFFGYLYLVKSAIIVHDEGASANTSAFSNLLELAILQMVFVREYGGRTVVVHANHERVSIKANLIQIEHLNVCSKWSGDLPF